MSKRKIIIGIFAMLMPLLLLGGGPLYHIELRYFPQYRLHAQTYGRVINQLDKAFDYTGPWEKRPFTYKVWNNIEGYYFTYIYWCGRYAPLGNFPPYLRAI